MNCQTKKFVCVFLLFCINDSVFSACVDDVKLFFFENKSTKNHFLHAFQHYNYDLIFQEGNNDNVRGYFESLLNFITEIRNNKVLPSVYCKKHRFGDEYDEECIEALYMLLINRDLQPNDEFTSVLNMTAIEAIHRLYLTQIFSLITVQNFFNSIHVNDFLPPQNVTRNISMQEAINNANLANARLEHETDRRRRLIVTMLNYFQFIFEVVSNILMPTDSNNIEEYCGW